MRFFSGRPGRRGARVVVLAVTPAALGLLAAGCGGGATPSVASLGTTGSTTTTVAASAPEPAAGGNGGGSSGGSGQGAVMKMAGGSRSTMIALAECMRKNGEPNFPDPNAQGQISISAADGIDPGSPRFHRALAACQKALPGGGPGPTPTQQAQLRTALLEYTACMRKNGVPNFPDPNFSNGNADIHIGPNSGIDPNSPQFQNAQQICQKDLPGRATKQHG